MRRNEVYEKPFGIYMLFKGQVRLQRDSVLWG